jgi:hypothetical protein
MSLKGTCALPRGHSAKSTDEQRAAEVDFAGLGRGRWFGSETRGGLRCALAPMSA